MRPLRVTGAIPPEGFEPPTLPLGRARSIQAELKRDGSALSRPLVYRVPARRATIERFSIPTQDATQSLCYNFPMKTPTKLLLILTAVFIVGCNSKPEAELVPGNGKAPDMFYVKSSNERMISATEEARRRTNEFVQALQNPKPGQNQFMIKVRVTDGNASEHMWLDHISFADGKFTGAFTDESIEVPGYRRGMTTTRPANEITDWLFYDQGKMVGGFTARVLEELAGARKP
jgi:uncharacterized protein YegJ (DUF2314 family)